MKLQNKETGEIRKGEAREDGIYLYDEITGQWYKYELDLLARGWKYYEEPKEVYYIDYRGYTYSESSDGVSANEKEIGNLFETREEAEKAVEKLKAWKRLKDAGIKLCGTDILEHKCCIKYPFSGDTRYTDEEMHKDLDLLFGGEE